MQWEMDRIRKDVELNGGRHFYNSYEWLKVREEALRRDHYECVDCRARGKYKRAVQVHHIKTLEKYPQYAYSLQNLVSLCIECHNERHGRGPGGTDAFLNTERW